VREITLKDILFKFSPKEARFVLRSINIDIRHPLRKLFRRALDFSLRSNPTNKSKVADYIEEQETDCKT
jgi:hypothetical protein